LRSLALRPRNVCFACKYRALPRAEMGFQSKFGCPLFQEMDRLPASRVIQLQ